MAGVRTFSPTKYGPSDWHTSNYVIQTSAERQRDVAHRMLQESETLRNETESKARWKQHGSDISVRNRVQEIENWVQELEKSLQDVEKEIDQLTETKERTVKALDAKSVPLEVAIQSLALREGRLEIDLVRDEVEAELSKEVQVLEEIQKILTQRVNDAFKQICVLQECHQRLHSDLKDKYSALRIDSDCMAMNNQSANISLHADPTRIKKGIISPDQWRSFSTHNISIAKQEIHNSTRLREAIYHTIQQTSNDLEAQHTATSYALNKRLHQVNQVKQELQWQEKNTETEIKEVEMEIQKLEQSVASKTAPMMVAHTRLESRTYRPNVELCRDKPQYNLVEEVLEITKIQKLLQDRLEAAIQTQGTLQRTLNCIKHDIDVKSNSFRLDQECLTLRERIPKMDGSPSKLSA